MLCAIIILLLNYGFIMESILILDKVSVISQNVEILKEVSFSIKKGEHVVIFGPENSGVDIICPVIADLIEDFTGEIFYKGKSIKTFDYLEKLSYKKKIGCIQRDYGLINNMTVEENILLPLKYHSNLSNKKIRNLVDKYIKDMNLDHCRSQRPVGLTQSETLKTAFLRSIILNPDLLLLEHPLEGQCILNVLSFIESFVKGLYSHDKSVIFITYEPKWFIDFSHKFIMLYRGKIVFSGSKDEYLAADNDYLLQFNNMTRDGPMMIL